MIKRYRSKEWLHEQYITKERSMKDIGRETQRDRRTISRWLDIHGIKKRTDPESIRLWYKKNPGATAGERCSAYKGGRTMSKGYIRIYSPNHPSGNSKNRVFEHRLVAEKALGRYLSPNEAVHHIDRDRANNKWSNLIVFPTKSLHAKFESMVDKQAGRGLWRQRLSR